MAYKLAPSKVFSGEIVSVSNIILGTTFVEFQQVLCSIQPAKPVSLENFGDKPVEGYISAIVTSFEHLQKAMLNLRINESCGYPMLGMKYGIICNLLTFLRGTTYRAEMEYPVVRRKLKGRNPACDVALVIERAEDLTPCLLCKYKPKVMSLVELIEGDQFVEILLQAFYCLKYHEVESVYHCLTDLTTYHYFLFKLDSTNTDRAIVEKQFTYTYDCLVPTASDVSAHLQQLLPLFC